MDLALNKLQWLIGHKTKPNQTKSLLNPSGYVYNIGCFNRYGTDVTANSSTTNSVFFFVSVLKIVYYNNN